MSEILTSIKILYNEYTELELVNLEIALALFQYFKITFLVFQLDSKFKIDID
jgi:hypothetical protein